MSEQEKLTREEGRSGKHTCFQTRPSALVTTHCRSAASEHETQSPLLCSPNWAVNMPRLLLLFLLLLFLLLLLHSRVRLLHFPRFRLVGL